MKNLKKCNDINKTYKKPTKLSNNRLNTAKYII